MEYISLVLTIFWIAIATFTIRKYHQITRIKRGQIYWAVAVCKNSDDYYNYLWWVKIKKNNKPKIRRFLSERREGPFTEEDCDYFIRNMKGL